MLEIRLTPLNERDRAPSGPPDCLPEKHLAPPEHQHRVISLGFEIGLQAGGVKTPVVDRPTGSAVIEKDMLVPIQQRDVPRKSLSKTGIDLAGGCAVVRTEENRQVYVWLSGNG